MTDRELLELVPVGLFMAAVLTMLWMQFELGGRVSAVEGRLGGIEARLGSVEARLDGMEAGLRQIQGTLVEISRTLGRLEGRPAPSPGP